MSDQIELSDLLTRVKTQLVKLSAKRTALEVDGISFEFSGQLEVGTELSITEGELPNSITLEDGRTLTIEDGVVKEIIEASAETEEIELSDEETEVEMEENDDEESEMEDEESEMEEDEEVVMEVEDRVAALEDQVSNISVEHAALNDRVAALENILSEMTALNEELSTQVEKLSKEPVVEPNRKKINNNFNKTQSRAAKVFAA